jgi:hypothetical protein
MKQPDEDALRFLKKAEGRLLVQLAKIRKAISALEPTSVTPDVERPRSKIGLLREILHQHREGVPVSAVSELLVAKGYEPLSPNSSTNWLSPSQLRPQDRFFIREAGWIKPTSKFLAEIDANTESRTTEHTTGRNGSNEIQS